MSHVSAVSDETFSSSVEERQGLVVVDVWAAWCAPCRALAPVVDQLAASYVGRVKFAKLDIDTNASTAARYDVRSIPTLLFFENGVLVDRTVGALSHSVLNLKVEQHVLRMSRNSDTAA